MKRRFELPVEIEPLAEGGYLVICPEIMGCHAEGDAIGQALDNLHAVARVIYELCLEKQLIFVTNHPEVNLEN